MFFSTAYYVISSEFPSNTRVLFQWEFLSLRSSCIRTCIYKQRTHSHLFWEKILDGNSVWDQPNNGKDGWNVLTVSLTFAKMNKNLFTISWVPPKKSIDFWIKHSIFALIFCQTQYIAYIFLSNSSIVFYQTVQCLTFALLESSGYIALQENRQIVYSLSRP